MIDIQWKYNGYIYMRMSRPTSPQNLHFYGVFEKASKNKIIFLYFIVILCWNDFLSRFLNSKGNLTCKCQVYSRIHFCLSLELVMSCHASCRNLTVQCSVLWDLTWDFKLDMSNMKTKNAGSQLGFPFKIKQSREDFFSKWGNLDRISF